MMIFYLVMSVLTSVVFFCVSWEHHGYQYWHRPKAMLWLVPITGLVWPAFVAFILYKMVRPNAD